MQSHMMIGKPGIEFSVVVFSAVVVAAMLFASTLAVLDAADVQVTDELGSRTVKAYKYGVTTVSFCAICAGVISLQYAVVRTKRLSNVGGKVHVQRQVQHVGSGVALIALFWVLPYQLSILTCSCACVGFWFVHQARAWSPEVDRQFLVQFGALLREAERTGQRPPGAFYFLLGFFLCAFLFPSRSATFGMVCVTLSDPLAATGGAIFGGPKLLGEKTLGGFVVCSLASALICAALVSGVDSLSPVICRHDWIGVGEVCAGLAVSGLCVGAAELVGGRLPHLDDNLTTSFGSVLLIRLATRMLGAAGFENCVLGALLVPNLPN